MSENSAFRNVSNRRPPPVKKADNSNVPLAPSVLAKLGHSPEGTNKTVGFESIILDPMITAFLFTDDIYSSQQQDIENELKVIAAMGTILPLQVFMWCEMQMSQLIQEFNMLPHGKDIDESLKKSRKISMYALIHSLVLKVWDLQSANDNPGWEIIVR